MKVTKISDTLLRLLFFNAVFMFVSQVFGATVFASLGFYLSFALVAALWFFVTYNSFTKIDLLLFSIASISLISVAVSFARSNVALSMEPFKKYIMFISCLAFFVSLYKLNKGTNFRKYLHFLNSAVIVILIAVYLIKGDECYVYNNTVSEYLLFGLDNPNKAAMFLLSISIMELIGFICSEKRTVKVLHFILFAAVTFFLLETKSRNSLLALAIFVFVMAIMKLSFFAHIQKSRAISFLFVLWPLIFAAVYMLFINNEVIKESLSFLVSEGKELDSRSVIWGKALELIRSRPLFGSYFEMEKFAGFSHVHNSHVDVAVSYGVPVLAAVCVLLYVLVRDFSLAADNKNKLYLLGFCSMIVMGMGESAMFIGGFGIYFFAGSFLLLCKKESPHENLELKP